MDMKSGTAHSERIHIGIFGRCNSGKSSLVNALIGQSVSIVSEISGTTTDPVIKAMEFPGLGASVLIDTAGLDDETELGQLRIRKTQEILDRTDIAILLFSGKDISVEKDWYGKLCSRNIPVVLAVSKCDRLSDTEMELIGEIKCFAGIEPIRLSTVTGEGIEPLRHAISSKCNEDKRLLTSGLCESGDTVLLVMPQDEQAPKDRLIKPQVQVLRELLDRGCVAVCSTVDTLKQSISLLVTPPRLVITDSQVFNVVSRLLPVDWRLTSFSILFARYKGDISLFIEGAHHINMLTECSRVLIAEACTHVPQHEDIGRVKLPRMLRKHVGEKLRIDVVGGNDFPEDLLGYDLVIHCGACMFNRRYMMSRVARANTQHVPITNYGVAMAALTGILDRVVY